MRTISVLFQPAFVEKMLQYFCQLYVPSLDLLQEFHDLFMLGTSELYAVLQVYQLEVYQGESYQLEREIRDIYHLKKSYLA